MNAEDVVAAIKNVVRSSFGKTLTTSGPVTPEEVDVVTTNVANMTIEGDINIDGSPDAIDTISAIGQIGTVISAVDLDRVSRELFTYIGVIRERGRAAMMVIECKPKNHLEGVSNTWPADHPSWWPENHLTGVSTSYNENRPGHLTAPSIQTPTPSPHEENVSKSWPANHLASSSDTWDKPKVPGTFSWSGPMYPPPHHESAVSTTWPSGHTKEASATWPSSHDQNTSRTWWPHHTANDSTEHIIPPMHISAVTQTWSHDTTLSQNMAFKSLLICLRWVGTGTPDEYEFRLPSGASELRLKWLAGSAGFMAAEPYGDGFNVVGRASAGWLACASPGSQLAVDV